MPDNGKNHELLIQLIFISDALNETRKVLDDLRDLYRADLIARHGEGSFFSELPNHLKASREGE